MARARYQQISLSDTTYYHCISRCVRRAYLCGHDVASGKDFNHRRAWLVRRIKQVSELFAIDISAYAIMSNHYHLVLHVDTVLAKNWTDEQVIERWLKLFPGKAKFIQTLLLNFETRIAQRTLNSLVSNWRTRLQDISWFMRCINEVIARKANKEDECTGRFWEGRFKSQALLDDKALLTCMAYVDLNPVRAGIANSLDASDYTSIQERLFIHARRSKNRSFRQQKLTTRRNVKHLLDIVAKPSQALQSLKPEPNSLGDSLPIDERSYLDLLENTCKALRFSTTEKKFNDDAASHPALGVTRISQMAWLKGVAAFHEFRGHAAGSASSLVRFQRSRLQAGVEFRHPDKWVRGISPARFFFGT